MPTRRRFMMLTAAGLTACGSSSKSPGVYVATPPTAPPSTNFGSLVDRTEFRTVSLALPPEVMSGIASSPLPPARMSPRVEPKAVPIWTASRVDTARVDKFSVVKEAG